MWAQDFESRLREWRQLRLDLQDKSLEEQLNTINTWWSHAPRINHLMHWNDRDNWLGPWDLLAEDGYCDLASALGLAYTIILVNKTANVELTKAVDEFGSDCIILVVNNDYILNWDLSSVISKEQHKFKITETYNCRELLDKIG